MGGVSEIAVHARRPRRARAADDRLRLSRDPADRATGDSQMTQDGLG
jgi:hypothetical protein